MFREILGIEQKSDGVQKHWFSSSTMDLFIWFGEDDEIACYQLTYSKRKNEKALSWSKEEGFSHFCVDDGARPDIHPRSPMLVEGGDIDLSIIMPMLEQEKGDLQPWIKDFILSSIKENSRANASNF